MNDYLQIWNQDRTETEIKPKLKPKHKILSPAHAFSIVSE